MQPLQLWRNPTCEAELIACTCYVAQMPLSPRLTLATVCRKLSSVRWTISHCEGIQDIAG